MEYFTPAYISCSGKHVIEKNLEISTFCDRIQIGSSHTSIQKRSHVINGYFKTFLKLLFVLPFHLPFLFPCKLIHLHIFFKVHFSGLALKHSLVL